MEHDQEKETIQAVLAGDRRAYARIVDAHKTAIFNLVYRMTGSVTEAEDIAQDTFIRAYNKLWRYDPSRPFFTWLYTIALNLTRNHLKKNKKTEFRHLEWSDTTAFEVGGATATEPEASLIDGEQQKELQECLLKLPRDMREALVLRFIDDRSFEEIAVILGISLSAAKMRVYRGLEKLKNIMT